jgi:hypothetical protein
VDKMGDGNFWIPDILKKWLVVKSKATHRKRRFIF